MIRGVTSVSPLLSTSRPTLPACCGDCVFWQTRRGVEDGRRRDAWGRAMEDDFGPFGRVLHEGDEFRGMLQYGPAPAFPRAEGMPAGPPDRSAGLVTCSFIEGDDPVGTCERLLLEALADLKGRGFRAVEAFALVTDDEAPAPQRIAGHHTLFDHALLTGLGFTPVRSAGPVALMRLPLGGLVEGGAPSMAARARRALARLGTPGTPAPA